VSLPRAQDFSLGDAYRIGISGSYSGLNLGDEAILKSRIVQFRRDVPDKV